MDSGKDLSKDIVRAVRLLMVAVSASVILMVAVVFRVSGLWERIFPARLITSVEEAAVPVQPAPEFWRPPDVVLVSDRAKADEINYGRELVAHTAQYLGPEGSVMKMSNGMNCQNCHLDAGTKIFGNNFGAVASTYPKFRGRSGTVESIEKRVNDCFERSLNGQSLDTASREMKAIVSYIQWLGNEVPKGTVPKGTGLLKLEALDRAADPAKGKALYETQCVVCHGVNGQGVTLAGGTGYQFPPLWGDKSYNHGAGLYRVSTFAQFIYTNMPLGATFENPLLTPEQAWDIAAYVNSLPRPARDISNDWPDIRLKPVDHPFGPYADPYSEAQHKFGPYQPIKAFYDARKPDVSVDARKQ